MFFLDFFARWPRPKPSTAISQDKWLDLKLLAYRCEAHQGIAAGCPCCDAVRIIELEGAIEEALHALGKGYLRICRDALMKVMRPPPQEAA